MGYSYYITKNGRRYAGIGPRATDGQQGVSKTTPTDTRGEANRKFKGQTNDPPRELQAAGGSPGAARDCNIPCASPLGQALLKIGVPEDGQRILQLGTAARLSETEIGGQLLQASTAADLRRIVGLEDLAELEFGATGVLLANSVTPEDARDVLELGNTATLDAGTTGKSLFLSTTTASARLVLELGSAALINESAIGASIITAADAASVRTLIGTVINVDVQGFDPTLAAIAGLTTAADQIIYSTGPDAFSMAPLTAFARTILDDGDAATVRTTIGAQESDSTLTALAGLTTAADQMIYSTGPDAFSTTSLTPFARTLLDDGDAATARATLGVDAAGSYQPIDATLTALAGLTTSADQMIYSTGVDAFSMTAITPFARTILDDGDALTVRSTIGAQASDATLTALAGLTTATDQMIYATGVDTFSMASLTPFARTILDDVDASTVRSTIGAQASDATLAALAGLATAADQMIYATGVDTFSMATLTPFARTLLDDGDAATARTTLGVDAAGSYQPIDATLTALAGLTTAGNQMIYSTGVDAFSMTSLTAFARTILDDADAPAVRTTIGAQADDATLTALAGLTTAADQMIYSTGVDAFSMASLTPFARTLLDDGDAATARATLGAEAAGSSQPLDATLTALAGLTTAADEMIYSTGIDTFSMTSLTSFARTILDDADAPTVRTTIGAQASDATLTALAGLTTAADQMIYSTGVDTFSMTALTSFARTLLDDGDAATARATLGVSEAGSSQPLDATLTALAGLTTATDQMIYSTGVDAFSMTALTSFARTILDDSSASAVRTTIGAQASDATLTALAGLTTAANQMIYSTGVDTFSMATLTSFARTILDDSSASAVRTTIAAQASDATLTALAGLTTSADQMIYSTGSDAFSMTSLTAFARTILDDADAATARGTLGLGSLATASTINNSNWSGTDLAVVNGGTGASDAGTARTNLGLGTIATQNANSVAITGGTAVFSAPAGNALQVDTSLGVSGGDTLTAATFTATHDVADAGTYYARGIYSSAVNSGESLENHMYGVYGVGSTGAAANNPSYCYGVHGLANGTTGTSNVINYGVYGIANGTGANTTNYGVYGTASGGASAFAGYFAGDVNVTTILHTAQINDSTSDSLTVYGDNSTFRISTNITDGRGPRIYWDSTSSSLKGSLRFTAKNTSGTITDFVEYQGVAAFTLAGSESGQAVIRVKNGSGTFTSGLTISAGTATASGNFVAASGYVQSQNGSASLPGIRGSDIDSGIFFATDQVSLTAASSEKLRASSAGITVYASISPNATNSYDLGAVSFAFRRMYMAGLNTVDTAGKRHLVLDGTEIKTMATAGVTGSFTDNLANTVTVTNGIITNLGAGEACPRLDAYIDGEWLTMGRVIRMNRGKANEKLHVIELPRQAQRFRVVEDEPERSYIKWIKGDGEKWPFGEQTTRPAPPGVLGNTDNLWQMEWEFSTPVSRIESYGYYEFFGTAGG